MAHREQKTLGTIVGVQGCSKLQRQLPRVPQAPMARPRLAE